MKLLSTLAIGLAMLAVVSCGGSGDPTQTPNPSNTPDRVPTLTLATAMPAGTTVPVALPTEPPTSAPTPPAPTNAPTPLPTAESSAPNCPTANSLPTAPGDVPPNIFLGTATIDGIVVPDGTNVTSCIDGEPVASALISEGRFLITIEQRVPPLNDKEIIFSVDGLDAKETAEWTQGGAVLIDLSAEK